MRRQCDRHPSSNELPPGRLKVMVTHGTVTEQWDGFAIEGFSTTSSTILRYATSILVPAESTWYVWTEVKAVQSSNCTIIINPDLIHARSDTIYQMTYMEASINSCPL